MSIHSTAVISKNAVIGKGVVVGPYAVIGDKVKIGQGTVIGSHVVIDGDTTIGEYNNIYPFASLGQDPQDLKYKGEETKLIIGDRNIIREFVTINKGTLAAGKTQIGNDNVLLSYGHIAHDCIVGNNCVFSNNATLAGHVEVGDFVVIGGMTPIHQFVKVGSHAMIGGASAVNMDIIPFSTAEGNKANLRGLNSVGLKRRGFTAEDIKNLKEAYKILFRSNMRLEEAVSLLKTRFSDDKNINYLLEFISKSQRGITRPKTKATEDEE